MIGKIQLVVALAGALTLSADARCDTITLKSSVRVAPDAATITLADIALLEGTEAERFADLEIATVTNQAQPHQIELHDVRAKLGQAGAHWGKLNLNGGAVIVRPGRGVEGASPRAMAPIDLTAAPSAVAAPSAEPDEGIATALVNEATLRGAIVRVIVNHLRTQPADLRLTFREADREFLSRPIDAARFEIQPQGNPGSDRIEVALRLWQGNRVAESKNVTVLPALRRVGARLVSDVGKDQTISPAHVQAVDVWLEPSQAAMNVPPERAVGRVITKGMQAGETLRENHLRRDALITRGELVTVRCLVGGVAISLQAEARSDAAQGELVTLRKNGERSEFTATAVARGQAIIDLSRRN